MSEIIFSKLDSIICDERNSKDHDVGEISKSVSRFGFVEPLIIDERTGKLVAGHGRLKTLRALEQKGAPPPPGIKLIDGRFAAPTVRGWKSKNDTEAQAYLLASNRLVEVGGWIDSSLLEQLKELHANDALSGTGFDPDDIDRLLADIGAPELPDDINEVPEVSDKAVWVQTGDVFRLGGSVIACGDSTDAVVANVALGGASADMCWTDPPWNVAYGKSDNRKIKNDDLGDAFPGFCQSFCGVMAQHLKPGAPTYVAMSSQEWPVIHSSLVTSGFHWSSTIIWAKDSLVLSRGDYHRQYEPIWYGWRDGAGRLVQLEDRKQSDLWEIPRPKVSAEHPTMKPIELVKRAIDNSSKRGAIVFEPFSGSGTTLIACELSGRKCGAVELDPKYVQVCIERWEKQFGKKHEKIFP